MPTKSRAASRKMTSADEPQSVAPDPKTEARQPSVEESLTADVGEAKSKSALRSVKATGVGLSATVVSQAEKRSKVSAATATAGSTMHAAKGGGVDDATVAGASRAETSRIDPSASRKAAAAFVAARKKMAPAVQPAVSAIKTIDETSKGTVQVSDRKMRKTVDDEAGNATAAPSAPAVEPAAERAPEVQPRGFVPAARAAMASKVKAPAGAKDHGFKTDEYIVYPAHGVGQITAVEQQEVAGYKLELFVISFAKDKMILKVPLPKIASVGMRKLAGPQVMKRALDTLTGRARVKRTMWSRRAQEYEAKINSGDLVAIAEVVRDLYRSDAQPEQSYSERQLYEAALDRMAREIAVVQKLTDTEALKLIDDQLQKGPRRGKVEDAEGEESEDGDEAGGLGEAA